MAAPLLLVIDDEPDIASMLRIGLTRQGYRVHTAHDAEAGLAAVRKQRPDLIILDVMMPRMDGFELIALLRRETSAPVIFVTAKKSEVDRVVAFKLGADDFVMKPFCVDELTGRVKAILRRTAPAARRGGHEPVRAGTLEVDVDRHDVRVDGRPCVLTPKEFDLLRLLVEADGKPLTREQLLEKVWGYERGLDLSTRTVDQHVARLRHKLTAEKERVVTVEKVGYRFEAR